MAVRDNNGTKTLRRLTCSNHPCGLHLICVSRTSITTRPGRPFTSRFSLAGLLAC